MKKSRTKRSNSKAAPKAEASARGKTQRAKAPAFSQWIRESNSAIHGRGIYARCAIPYATRIIEYMGERITKAESRLREEQRIARQKRGGDGCVYVFDVNKRFDLDGRVRGNIARFINHSCQPNCESEIVRGHVWISARRDIAEGEELTFDYGFPYKEWKLHPCRCGSPKCVGYIVNKGQRWLVRRAKRAEKTKKYTAKS